MRLTFYRVHVEWMDGKEEVFETVTKAIESREAEQLNLYLQDGEMAPVEHLASIPLANIRKWKAERKW